MEIPSDLEIGTIFEEIDYDTLVGTEFVWRYLVLDRRWVDDKLVPAEYWYKVLVLAGEPEYTGRVLNNFRMPPHFRVLYEI